VACSPKGSRLMQALLEGGASPPTLLATLEALGGANFVPLLMKCVRCPVCVCVRERERERERGGAPCERVASWVGDVAAH
jgi:hypothetical protein